MKRFIIEEDERERVLNMHKNAIKKQYLSEQSQVVDKQNPLYKMAEKLVDEYYPNLDDFTTDEIIKNLNDRTINYDENSTFYDELNPNLVPFMKQIIQDKSNGNINFESK
jgi:hypothetical protein